ncbi:MAG TPA: pyridoxal-dependent decarboxylase [Gemmatimonadaceae bacterium]|nr:pyridoxal-dependent decarboxylase [Gemmatimonadaceae bacterium]
MPDAFTSDESLDPRDWAEFRALAHRMVDDSLDFLATLGERAPWQPMPEHVRRALTEEPLPRTGQSAERAYEEFLVNVLPFTNGNRHPRFWGWIQGNGTPLGMMADMLAAGMNAHLAGLDQAPKLVELQVIAWLAELMGFPRGSSGLLVSGGTMANFVGLAVARHAKAGFDVRQEGLHGQTRLTVYASSEIHSWAQKAVELMGMGNASLRRVPVDGALRMSVRALREMLTADRARGMRPICIVGTAGTVNSGAIDDLDALADLAAAEDLWFHVDGAFGALARLVPELAPRVKGMERADSLAFDLHKWMYLPYEIACVLVKDARMHEATFSLTPNYLTDEGRGVISGGLPFADRGLELTRNFKALKVWLSLKAHGVDAFARIIAQNVAQAGALAERLTRIPHVVLAAPVSLNIVCFRVTRPAHAPEEADAFNKELLLRIQETGLAVVSGSRIAGRYVIRVACSNHRSKWEDFEALANGIEKLSAEMESPSASANSASGGDSGTHPHARGG